MRTLLLILLFLPVLASAQKTLTGVWTGALTNDSSQARNDQQFELALTEYKGRVYGYSYATFLEGDYLYYIVKRVEGKIENGVCEVTDDELVSSNLSTKLDKRVKRTIVFRMNPVDSIWRLDGVWRTNKTREFYAITGGVTLTEEKDPGRSRVFEHLKDLGLTKKLEWETLGANNKSQVPNAKSQVPNNKSEAPNSNTEGPKMTEVLVKIEEKQPEKSKKPSKKEEKTAKIEEIKKTESAPVMPVLAARKPAEALGKRSLATPETISFVSDSLVIALYDNGEVDGDTVSVLLNGELILPNQGLSSTAIKKTIQVPAGTESLELVLYAENLGKYPPNTGLLVIYDGEKRHLVRFSADLNRNAQIILKRRKHE